MRGLVNASGTLSNAVDYSPYGVPDPGIYGFAFTGEQLDSNGLQFHRARYYVPSLGIFPSRDPFEGVQSRPMSLNEYSWVEGNPVMLTDASGMYGETPNQYAGCLENR